MTRRHRHLTPAEWKLLRAFVRERDQNRCRYCGAEGRELDHVRATNHGGKTQATNLVVACDNCNRRKGREGGFWMRDGVLYYKGQVVAPDGLFGEPLIRLIEENRRQRQAAKGLPWASASRAP